MSDKIFVEIHQELRQGTDVCLATIVNRIGSAPRSAGTRFLVRGDGSFSGTIGGGLLEAEVIEKAGQVLTSATTELFRFRMNGRQVAEMDMICGGNVDVYLEPWFASDGTAQDISASAARAARHGVRALCVTPILPGPARSLAGRKLLLVEGEDPLGVIAQAPDLTVLLSADLEELLSSPLPKTVRMPPAAGPDAELYLEPLLSRPMVYLFGGGHISLHLADLVKRVGFGLAVFDDRAEFSDAQRFPQADSVHTRDFGNILDGIPLGPDAYVVIVTRGHLHDKEVLAQVLRKETAYVGMIGSRRKRAMIYQALEEEGVSKETLSGVHSPIGLDIGAETPEEIAVSIAAELIAVRAGKMK